MKIFLVFILAVHGLIHLMGFVKEWKLAPISQLTGETLFPLAKDTAKVIGLFWLLTCFVFLSSAVGYLVNKGWWWVLVLAGVIISQLLIILYWKDAKWGTIANAILLMVTIVSYAEWKFNKKVCGEIKQMFEQDINHEK